MIPVALARFREAWAIDFEFRALPGELPSPTCLVARELGSGRTLRLWTDALEALPAAPFPVGRETVVIAFYASAEIGCFLSLGWPLPENVLDLYAEFRCRTNGLSTPCGWGLLALCANMK